MKEIENKIVAWDQDVLNAELMEAMLSLINHLTIIWVIIKIPLKVFIFYTFLVVKNRGQQKECLI